MPYSSDVFNGLVQKIFEYLSPNRLLDIGTGAGKYCRMMRSAVPESHIIAVEIEPEYVANFNLKSLANEVRCIDAAQLIKNVDENYDLVVFGDSIEHMRKSEGVDLLHFLVYRTRFILIIYPDRYVQNSVDGVIAEAHLSVWCEQDFQCLAHTNIIERDGQRLVVIEGYLSKNGDIASINNILNTYMWEEKA